jgi:hypothetical protein
MTQWLFKLTRAKKVCKMHVNSVPSEKVLHGLAKKWKVNRSRKIKKAKWGSRCGRGPPKSWQDPSAHTAWMIILGSKASLSSILNYNVD